VVGDAGTWLLIRCCVVFKADEGQAFLESSVGFDEFGCSVEPQTIRVRIDLGNTGAPLDMLSFIAIQKSAWYDG